MSAKRMLIILGVLIALFFVVTGWGQLSDEQSAGGVAKAIVNMIRGLETKEPLSPNDLTGADPPDCREQLRRKQFTLAEGQSCELAVGDASAPSVRTLTLQLQQGNQVRLRLSAGEDDDTEQTATLPTDGENPKTLELQFGRERGRLVIACPESVSSSRQCVLTVP